MSLFFGSELTHEELKKNLFKQGSKILHSIVESYEKGILDNPEQALIFCGLLACACEGKVEGTLDDESGLVKWSLTDKFEKDLQTLRDAMIDTGNMGDNVVKGPWS